MENPKVSVIMATFNRGDLIENAIKSVINQAYENWELHVVMDGCTDNTGEVVSRFVQDDERVYMHDCDKFDYYTHVRNYGIDHSDGELIAFRDDDSAWTPNFLEEHVKRHKNNNVVISYCGRILVNGVNFAGVDVTKLEKLNGIEMDLANFDGIDSLTNKIDVGDIVIKRSVFNDTFTGFSTEKDRPGYCSDALLVDDIFRANPGGQIVLIPLYMHYYFQNHGGKVENMTQRKLKYRAENDGELGDEEEAWSF